MAQGTLWHSIAKREPGEPCTKHRLYGLISFYCVRVISLCEPGAMSSQINLCANGTIMARQPEPKPWGLDAAHKIKPKEERRASLAGNGAVGNDEIWLARYESIEISPYYQHLTCPVPRWMGEYDRVRSFKCFSNLSGTGLQNKRLRCLQNPEERTGLVWFTHAGLINVNVTWQCSLTSGVSVTRKSDCVSIYGWSQGYRLDNKEL